MTNLREKIIQEYLLIEGDILNSSTFVFCAELLDNKKKGTSIAYIFYFINNGWELRSELNFQPVSITVGTNDQSDVFVLGREGECVQIIDKNINYLNISDDQDEIGPFRKIKNIGGKIYVLGEDCSLWALTLNKWKKIRDGLNEFEFLSNYELNGGNEDELIDNLIQGTEVAFSFDGDAHNGLIQVGTNGKIWLFDGEKWSEEASPTNITLYDICRAEGERYYICGIKGTLITVDGQSLSVVDLGGVDNDFCSITEYSKKIYVADGNGLFKVDKTGIISVDFGADEDVPSHFVTSRCGVILSLAAKEALISSDGDNWRSLLF